MKIKIYLAIIIDQTFFFYVCIKYIFWIYLRNFSNAVCIKSYYEDCAIRENCIWYILVLISNNECKLIYIEKKITDQFLLHYLKDRFQTVLLNQIRINMNNKEFNK